MGGSIEIDEIVENVPNYTDYKIFIETGTYHGNTIRRMAEYFDELYTFEIHPKLYQICLVQNNSPKIKYFQGDSVELLPKVIKQFNLIDKKCLFFLDAHISSNDSGYNPKYDVPLMQEILVIAEYCTNKCILCIDDVRFFINSAFAPTNWKHITIDNIINIIGEKRIEKYFVNNDRLWLFLNETDLK